MNKTRLMTFIATGIVINIALSLVVKTLGIPLLFLDTVGTIFIAAVFGPLAGAITGGLTNLVNGVLVGPTEIPFALVNITVAIVVGLIAKRFKFDIKTAVITGLILSVVAPLIGTPIAVFMFGGLTGGGTDLLFAWLRATGQTVFASAFIPRITGNIIDKVISCILVAVLITRMPGDLLNMKKDKAA
ncbi:ECF transporter S component [Acidaminobacter sp. JC074]|uniref:CD3073 family putative ECF transporter S component n=1 Tax=Acidaminobacter sp. JC074 TaxID=2530199 RepID=UPI001F0F6C80|nr:CD3073 family putative ECF transporter S component [Acidaminobacter sp. JC074]MCH4886848.1 ECF transporter S component [Acidaminobacter sp. JC074]